jgi:acetoin utilization deacetylase AcuC-like enzyme
VPSPCDNLSMSLLLVTHDLGLAHTSPEGHPERTDRLRATLAGFHRSLPSITDVVAPRVERGALERVHDHEYIDEIHNFCLDGGGMLDQDTFAVPDSWEAALHAAGAGIAAVDHLTEGIGDTAFVAVRPPGHHAERHQAMGFCLFNNIAVTAEYLRSLGQRIAVVDWDVHHGNGTQRTFWTEPDVLYVSLHEFPFYPGTGWVTEAGGEEGVGATVNVALPSGTSSGDFLAAFGRVVLPVVDQFSPDWILVSAGYDAHIRDPLGGLGVETSAYGTMAGALAGIVPANRIVSFLEGGYDLTALATAPVATVHGILAPSTDVSWPEMSNGSAVRLVDLTVEIASKYWDLE